jgi:hypothetical protein
MDKHTNKKCLRTFAYGQTAPDMLVGVVSGNNPKICVHP